MISRIFTFALACAIAGSVPAAKTAAKPGRPPSLPRIENPAGLGSPVFANWYALGETVVFTNALPQGTAMEGTVFDSSGAERYRALAKGNSWTWKPSGRGFYTVRFEAVAADGKRTPISMLHRAITWDTAKKPAQRIVLGEYSRDSFAVAVSPAPPRQPAEASPKFGFNVSAHALPPVHADQFAIVKLLGMSSFIRYHYFRWNEIEAKEQGVRDWTAVDRSFADAAAAGYGLDRILVNIYGTPDWLSTAPEVVEPGWHNRKALYPPRDMAPLRDFTKAFCKRYPGIRQFEIWNEPHLDGHSVFWKKGTPGQFVELMKAGYEGVKAADPSITVVMGGIGMRYLPFYEEYVKLGGVKWYDMMDTHCGYDMRPFREVEARHGAESKPYWEGEWHTVLYNCSNPEPPSEEECAFRMLVNFADLIHTVPGRVTGFGLTCGDRTPETAKWFAKVGGIQQVLGLFRSMPMMEPRFAAYALRCATDLFAGDVRSQGAWRYGDDGSYRAALFTSAAGAVAFVWSNSLRNRHGVLPPELMDAAAKGGRWLDWEGRPAAVAAMRPRRMYYLLSPDAASLRRGDPLEVLDYSSYNFKGYEKYRVPTGVYGPDGNMPRNPLGNGGASFAADLSTEEFKIDVYQPGAERPSGFRFAMDSAEKGALQDVLEFEAMPGVPLVKTRTPELNGDIPSDYSPANVPLARSRVSLEKDGDGWRWRVSVWRGDLYPFACIPFRRIRLAVSLPEVKDDAWGRGLGKIREPALFGTLVPWGKDRILARTENVAGKFGDASVSCDNGVLSVAATSGERAAGAEYRVRAVPGSRLSFKMKARGTGMVFATAWASAGKGTKSVRVDAGSYNLSPGKWTEYSGELVLPSGVPEVSFRLFSWRRRDASWEVKDFTLVNN